MPRPLHILPLLSASWAFCLSAYAQTPNGIDEAWRVFQRHLLLESAGVFWIAAELAILFTMMVAVRMFAERPVPTRLQLTRHERRLAIRMALLVLALAAFVYGRYLVQRPLPFAVIDLAEGDAGLIDSTRAAYLARAHVHAALWVTLVAVWVFLEAAIVIYGIKAFRRLRTLTGATRHA